MGRQIHRFSGQEIFTINDGEHVDLVLKTGATFHGPITFSENKQSLSIRITRKKIKFNISDVEEIIV